MHDTPGFDPVVATPKVNQSEKLLETNPLIQTSPIHEQHSVNENSNTVPVVLPDGKGDNTMISPTAKLGDAHSLGEDSNDPPINGQICLWLPNLLPR